MDPSTIVSTLTIGHQQLVEIAKALSVNARVLIMDEPTSSLSQHETEQLFKVIEDLSSKELPSSTFLIASVRSSAGGSSGGAQGW